MSFYFFAVPAFDPEAEQSRLNDFCHRHRVVSVDRQFVNDGANSHWAICIQIAHGPGPLPDALRLRAERHAPADGSRRNAVDWKQVLNEPDFQVFARLRSLRKTLAESAGVPIFAVFSNEQLAAIVQTRPASLVELGRIDGIGAARLERYGAAMLDCMTIAQSALPPTHPAGVDGLV